MPWESLIHFVFAALATWRISFLLAREEGPGGIFSWLRQSTADRFLGRLLRCVKCVSLWGAIPFAFYVADRWLDLAVVWLALSGVASLIDEATGPPFEWQESDHGELLRSDGDRASH